MFLALILLNVYFKRAVESDIKILWISYQDIKNKPFFIPFSYKMILLRNYLSTLMIKTSSWSFNSWHLMSRIRIRNSVVFKKLCLTSSVARSRFKKFQIHDIIYYIHLDKLGSSSRKHETIFFTWNWIVVDFFLESYLLLSIATPHRKCSGNNFSQLFSMKEIEAGEDFFC